MAAFLVRRLVGMAAVLLVVSIAVYGLIGLMPGDPVDLMIAGDPTISPETAARLRRLEGLDRPLPLRWAAWAGRALGGDFGWSRSHARPVGAVLAPALGFTLVLMGAALALSVLLALAAALAAARRPRSALDTAVNLAAFAGISIPSFWLALLLILVFAVTLGWLPAGGPPPPDAGPAGWLAHLALPALCLAVLGTGGIARFLRASLLQQLAQDYIRTARAKGLGETAILWRHALRNALVPVVTVVALDLGALFGGALTVETVFAWPGMGRLIYDAILGNDFNLALVALMAATAAVLLANLAADLLYLVIDPRVGAPGPPP